MSRKNRTVLLVNVGLALLMCCGAASIAGLLVLISAPIGAGGFGGGGTVAVIPVHGVIMSGDGDGFATDAIAYADRVMDGVMFKRSNAGMRVRKDAISPLVESFEAQAFRNYVDHVMDNYSLRTFTPTAMMLSIPVCAGSAASVIDPPVALCGSIKKVQNIATRTNRPIAVSSSTGCRADDVRPPY